MPDATTEDAHPEDPNRFPDEVAADVAALDEAPDGHTPAEATGSDSDSLPPGASKKPE